MKVIGFNGSARRDGNTAAMVKVVFAELEKEGVETELYQMAGKKIRGCIACYKCFKNKDGHCAVTGDIVNECLDKMAEADGIVLGSPTYFANASPEIMALVCRAGMVAIANDAMLRRKVGAAVIAVRRSGANHAFNSLNHFFFISQMIVPGSRYWNMGLARDIGEFEKDEEGILTMEVLGQNMAWLLKKLEE
jgi:multimeric flavodoxin WrbA